MDNWRRGERAKDTQTWFKIIFIRSFLFFWTVQSPHPKKKGGVYEWSKRDKIGKE